ncbi:hypothetical protein HPB50_008801 [Hyalomma asiaticum]|uniref:Uncharacterized protein n=1 Tax=Hyalomma asiaticum TaxID=266040 RepID=A0ACB7SSU1_HYAAI|nr:hypothetical protein HPB50_008801 [Hyalomma asiaticum]
MRSAAACLGVLACLLGAATAGYHQPWKPDEIVKLVHKVVPYPHPVPVPKPFPVPKVIHVPHVVHVPHPVPVPVKVPVIKKIPKLVPVAKTIPIPKPVPVPHYVSVGVPVPVIKHQPVPIYKHVPVPRVVPVPVPVKVPKLVPVPVHKIIHVPKPVHVPVKVPVFKEIIVKKPVEVPVPPLVLSTFDGFVEKRRRRRPAVERARPAWRENRATSFRREQSGLPADKKLAGWPLRGRRRRDVLSPSNRTPTAVAHGEVPLALERYISTARPTTLSVRQRRAAGATTPRRGAIGPVLELDYSEPKSSSSLCRDCALPSPVAERVRPLRNVSWRRSDLEKKNARCAQTICTRSQQSDGS